MSLSGGPPPGGPPGAKEVLNGVGGAAVPVLQEPLPNAAAVPVEQEPPLIAFSCKVCPRPAKLLNGTPGGGIDVATCCCKWTKGTGLKLLLEDCWIVSVCVGKTQVGVVKDEARRTCSFT